MELKPMVYRFESIDSTNNEAKRHIENGGELPALFIADRQTAGRGRQGKSFFSEGGLYMSLALPFDVLKGDVLRATTLTAVAVAQVFEKEFGKRLLIKWVNDLYFEDRKVCGILCETVYDKGTLKAKAVVIGVGINLNVSRFPNELQSKAGGIFCDCADKDKLARLISGRIIEIICGQEDYIGFYKSRCFVVGKDIYFTEKGETKEARAVGINDDLALIIEMPDKSRRALSSGEISIRVK